LKAGSAEITVSQEGAGTGSGSISENKIAEIEKLAGVKSTAGALRVNANLPSSSSTTGGLPNPGTGGMGGLSVTGIDSSKLSLVGIDSVNGSVFSSGSANEIIIGKTAAENINKTVGDTITLYGEEFKITGTFESGNFMTDMGGFTSLNKLQNLTNSTDSVSNIYVKVTDNANVTEVSKTIENAYPGELSTTTAADQAGRMDDALGSIETATWAISLLAIIIGGLGVINTMIMSVNERTREIGVLKAVGWKEKRILGMILGESIVLTLMAAVVGIIVAVVGVELLSMFFLGDSITPVLSLDTILRALGVAFGVGILGGLYPAYRASKLAPTEALRYE
jgi:putative ABC transport system permease protein